MDYICIIAAGNGSRLLPLTTSIPKLLITGVEKCMLIEIIEEYKKYCKNFIIVINEEYNKLLNFYKNKLDVNITIENVNIENGYENSYTIMKSLNKKQYYNKSLLITWCDVIIKDKIKIEELIYDDLIFVVNDKNYESRYKMGNKLEKLEKENYKEGNVLGVYYFYDFQGIDNKGNNKLDLCDCLKDKEIYKYEIKKYIDIGDYNKLLEVRKMKKYNTRYINEIIEYNDLFLLKRGLNIKNEYDFYNYTKELNYYPISKDIKNINDNSFIKRNYKNYIPLYKNINEYILNKLLNKLEYSYKKTKKEVSIEKLKDDYKQETIIKINNKLKEYSGLLYKNIKTVNNTLITNINNLIKNMKYLINNIDKLNISKDYTIFHGDLNLSNVLVNNKNELILIDPKGYFGETKYYGSKYYEIAKIIFSLTGFDDIHNSGLSYYTKENKNINTNVKLNKLDLINKILSRFNNHEQILIKVLCISTWLVMPSYYINEPLKLITCYYHGLYVATILMNNYNITKRILLPRNEDYKILKMLKSTKKYELEEQPKKYDNLIIKKPWGYEFLATTEYKNISVWMLNMKKGGQTSLHCHEGKNTPMILLEGELYIELLNKKRIKVKKGEIIYINQKLFHSLLSMKDNTILMELEIKPNKCDLYRYKDKYSRSDKGYEGISNVIINNELFYNGYDKIYKKYGSTSILFNNKDLKNIFPNNIYILLNTGEIYYGYELLKDNNNKVENYIEINYKYNT